MANLPKLGAFAAAGQGDVKLHIVRLNDVRRIDIPATAGRPCHERLWHQFNRRQFRC
jgi:hypothetical protein